MDSNNKGITDYLVEAIPFVFAMLMSAAGGAVRYLNNVNRGSVTFKMTSFFIEIFISGFVGVVAYMLCDYASLSWSATGAIVAISGHMGVRALSIAEEIAVNSMKVYLKGKPNASQKSKDS